MQKVLKKKLKNYLEQNLVRRRTIINGRSENQIEIASLRAINFASNDYLGLTTHPDIKKAFIAVTTATTP